MPESKDNTHRQGSTPKPFLDDYLPDYSPRPKYVIATIYPPSSERHERGLIDTGWKESSLGIPAGRVAGSGSGSADPLVSSPVLIGTVGQLPKSSGLVTEPYEKECRPHMELPRGKFRSLERNASLISLLQRLYIRAFRGSARINRNGNTILLVYDQGKIILAEYDNLAGDAAIEMICTHRFSSVDAIISDLDDAQIRLSLEFNPSRRVQADQAPSCIVSLGRMPDTARNLSLPEEPAPEPELQKYQEAASGPEIRSVHPNAGAPEAPGEQVGLTGPDGADTPDWRKALTMPLTPSRDDPVSFAQPDPGIPQVQEREVDWMNALTTPLIPRRSGEDIRKSHETGNPENQGEVEGWKKALYTPVISAHPEEKASAEQATGVTSRLSAGIPDFELLSSDSVLFDDVSVEKKMPKAPAPEPAEQWKSMGMNRGENSSV
jgi:hypothetical protein